MKPMKPTEFNAIMARLDLTQGAMADLLGKSIRMVNGYANGEDIPVLVARFLRVIDKHKINIDKID